MNTMESALTRTGRLMEAASKKCRESPEVVKAIAKKKGLAALEGSCTIAGSSQVGSVRFGSVRFGSVRFPVRYSRRFGNSRALP